MRHTLLTVVTVLCAGLFSSAWAAEVEVRAEFNGSSELPTGIAFQTFLVLTNTETVLEEMDPNGIDPGIMDLVSTALAIPLTKESITTVEDRVRMFRNADNALRHEKRLTRQQMLCSESRGSRSKQQTYDLLNAVDDMQEIIAEKHYLLTASALTPAEKKALDNYLSKMKEGISYSKVDERSYFESYQIDIAATLEAKCSELAGTIS